tara:strand:- start:3165 stop:3638 length:474 start_codon:yes stop_codon:yes gene_type:complete
MKEIKNPLTANIDRSKGNIEVSIAKKYSDSEEPIYKKFMGMCAMNDSYAVETKDMDDRQTEKACGNLYQQKMRPIVAKVEANLFQKKPMLAGLSEDQKKNLPPELKKAILQKMKKEGKITEEAEAAYSKLLSKDDQKEKEVAPQDDIKVVEKPKKNA